MAQELGVEFDTVEYMKKANRPDRAALERIVSILDGPVADLVRKDSKFQKLELVAEDYVTPEAVVEVLLKHPALLQRPIVVRGNRAVVGRPKERVRKLLTD